MPPVRCAEEGNPLLLRRGPAGIGIELGHCGSGLCSGAAQVLLEQHAILVNDERHHAGVAVFSGIGDESKTAGHLSIDHVVLRAAGRVTPLPSEHMEVVAMERHMRIRLQAISFVGGECRQWPERAFGLTFRRLPVQTVLLAGVTDELHSELVRASVIVTL